MGFFFQYHLPWAMLIHIFNELECVKTPFCIFYIFLSKYSIESYPLPSKKKAIIAWQADLMPI
jgi:hypothetical protein